MVKPYLNLRLDECIIALKDLVKDYKNNSKESLLLLLDILEEIEIPELVSDIIPDYEAQAHKIALIASDQHFPYMTQKLLVAHYKQLKL